MTARLANGGLSVRPRLYRAVGEEQVDLAPVTQIPVQGRWTALVKKAMNGVSNEPGGTAYSRRITQEGLELAGKTGTSQVRRITKAERARGIFKNEDLPWNRRDHALFVAFAPVADPRYAVSVVVEHGGSGSRAAAPVARDLMLEAMRRDPVLASRFDDDPASDRT